MSTAIQSIERLAGIVLAAGGSSRLGQPKQLLQKSGKPQIYNVIKSISRFCGAGVFVVTGADAADVEAAITGCHVRIVRNENWQRGMASSIVSGLGACMDMDIDALLIMLCDQPHVSSNDVARLVESWQNSPSRIAAAAYRETIGAPAIFPAVYFDELMKLEGDTGAQQILLAQSDVNEVEMPSAGFDIDTHADLSLIANQP
ncbi:MAG: NTP transferase domain-containing protein [Xanthomonadales bacterium]|nr:NTP transferase domain-containing protein [Xanthomonadales bacterium]